MLSKDEASIDTAGSSEGGKVQNNCTCSTCSTCSTALIALVANSGVFPEYKTKALIIVLEKMLRTLPLNSRKRRVRAEHHAARNNSR